MKRLRQLSENAGSAKQFVNYEKARSIFLLFESDISERNPEIRRIVEKLHADGKRVTAMGYLDKKIMMEPGTTEFRLLCHQDFDIFQRPKPHVIRELQEHQYDLLIDISTRILLPVDYIVMYANVRFKAGMKKTEVNPYDFIMDMEQFLEQREMSAVDLDFSFLYNQIIFFLKKIQTND